MSKKSAKGKAYRLKSADYIYYYCYDEKDDIAYCVYLVAPEERECKVVWGRKEYPEDFEQFCDPITKREFFEIYDKLLNDKRDMIEN